jgi:hypothetical protein
MNGAVSMAKGSANHMKESTPARCDDKLGQTKTAAMIDQIGLPRIFELGVGIGCGNSSEKELTNDRLDAALTGIIEVFAALKRNEN